MWSNSLFVVVWWVSTSTVVCRCLHWPVTPPSHHGGTTPPTFHTRLSPTFLFAPGRRTRVGWLRYHYHCSDVTSLGSTPSTEPSGSYKVYRNLVPRHTPTRTFPTYGGKGKFESQGGRGIVETELLWCFSRLPTRTSSLVVWMTPGWYVFYGVVPDTSSDVCTTPPKTRRSLSHTFQFSSVMCVSIGYGYLFLCRICQNTTTLSSRVRSINYRLSLHKKCQDLLTSGPGSTVVDHRRLPEELHRSGPSYPVFNRLRHRSVPPSRLLSSEWGRLGKIFLQ